MQYQWQFILIPIAILLSVWLIKPLQRMTAISAVLFWIQAATIGLLLTPLFQGQTGEILILADFSTDKPGALFALLTQVVVAAAMTQAHFFFQQELKQHEEQLPIRLFYTCATLFLLAMTSVFFCNNLGFLWISVEATTLCSAPLVYFNKDKHALEAAWKYLMICSVGIAFALLGTMFLFASSQHGAFFGGSLNLNELLAHAKTLEYPFLKLGFLFCLLGYGTKAGIFPLHCWLPDAHSEAPAPASAMLSGGLLNCALFAIWRISQIVIAAGHEALVHQVAVYAGVVTVFIASILLLRQYAIKRLFAYSSIENVGLMLIAIGLGSGHLFFALAINHSAAKVALFLLSGNVIQCTGSKTLKDIHGLLAINPYWAACFAFAAFAVTGTPPFGSFAAELELLTVVCNSHLWFVLGALLVSLAIGFLSMTMYVGKMLCGSPRATVATLPPIKSTIIPCCLLLITFVCGISALPHVWWQP